MSRDHRHIPHDPDLGLAREYGRILDGATSEQVRKDPLFNLLSRSRVTSQRMEENTPVYGHEESWRALSSSIQKTGKKNSGTFFRLPVPQYWIRLAAAILLGLFFSMLFIIQPFDSENKIVVQAGSSLTTVTLDDGSRVTLRPNSTLAKYPSEGDRGYSLTGDALFEVESTQNQTFSVLAGNGRVVVTGTTFHVSSRERRSSVHLLEGRVRFETTDGSHSVYLAPGDASTVNEKMQLLDPYEFQQDEIIGWTQNRLIFNNRPVSRLLEELEFHFDIYLDAPNSIQSDSLGGSISLESQEIALTDLGTVLGGYFERTNEKQYRFRAGNETTP